MKALSLHQPWGTAIALGAKRIETRHWSTRYRGPLAIHAAKHLVKADMEMLSASWVWRAALNWLPQSPRDLISNKLPFGAIVATCTLVDCIPSEEFDDLDRRRTHLIPLMEGSWTERQMGNFGPGRFGWVLDDVKALDAPIPFRGLQGLFNVPDELLQ